MQSHAVICSTWLVHGMQGQLCTNAKHVAYTVHPDRALSNSASGSFAQHGGKERLMSCEHQVHETQDSRFTQHLLVVFGPAPNRDYSLQHASAYISHPPFCGALPHACNCRLEYTQNILEYQGGVSRTHP